MNVNDCIFLLCTIFVSFVAIDVTFYSNKNAEKVEQRKVQKVEPRMHFGF